MSKRVGFNLISPEEAKHFAGKLMEQGNPESALRQLNRADHKDADFFYIQGNILMRLEQFDTAYQSYREAVRLKPRGNPLPARRAGRIPGHQAQPYPLV